MPHPANVLPANLRGVHGRITFDALLTVRRQSAPGRRASISSAVRNDGVR